MKKCKECKEKKANREFYTSSIQKDGLMAKCKSCWIGIDPAETSVFKTCSKCREHKPVHQYSVDNRAQDKLRATCKACDKSYKRNRPTPPKPKLKANISLNEVKAARAKFASNELESLRSEVAYLRYIVDNLTE